MSLEEIWRGKSDEEVFEAAKHVDDYTADGKAVILAEVTRRSTPEWKAAQPPDNEQSASPNAWSPMYGSGLRVVGFFVVFGIALIATSIVSPILGDVMAENSSAASLALVVGYYLRQKKDRGFSNVLHWFVFAGFLLATAVVRIVLIPVGQPVPRERLGVLFLIEVALGWAAYWAAARARKG